MRVFTKPIVVVSKCIEFEPVRWDGRIIASEFVKTLKDFVDFIPTCPEVEIGLSVPRDPVRIVKKGQTFRLIQPASGMDFTDKLLKHSNSFLSALHDVDGFILKSKSPSSAFKDARIYPSEGKVAALGRGPGFFGRAVLDKFPNKAIEDETRLLNERIRHHFLTKIFTLAVSERQKKRVQAIDSYLFKLETSCYSRPIIRISFTSWGALWQKEKRNHSKN